MNNYVGINDFQIAFPCTYLRSNSNARFQFLTFYGTKFVTIKNKNYFVMFTFYYIHYKVDIGVYSVYITRNN